MFDKIKKKTQEFGEKAKEATVGAKPKLENAKEKVYDILSKELKKEK